MENYLLLYKEKEETVSGTKLTFKSSINYVGVVADKRLLICT